MIMATEEIRIYDAENAVISYLKRHPGKCYIDCPYEQKDKARKMGAKWDSDRKKWYVERGMNVQPFFELWKTHCRVCNAHLTCERGKGGPCEHTEAGLCCVYEWVGSDHCQSDKHWEYNSIEQRYYHAR
jgi:hypothetical protein